MGSEACMVLITKTCYDNRLEGNKKVMKFFIVSFIMSWFNILSKNIKRRCFVFIHYYSKTVLIFGIVVVDNIGVRILTNKSRHI